MASKLTKWHFAPTAFSRQNLLDELVPDAAISVTGNTVIDALFWMLGRIDADAQRHSVLEVFLTKQLNFDWQNQRFVLVTGHRREIFGDGFLKICHALVSSIIDLFRAAYLRVLMCDNNCSISAGVSVFACAMVCVSLNHVFALTALCFHIFIRTTRYRMSPARHSGYLWLAMAKRTACG